ncbi:MAG: YggT family protein [Eubacteriales bacterium]
MDILRTVGEQVVNILAVILDVYVYVILIRVIMSWFVPKDSNLFQFFAFITDPVLEPIRRKLKPLMMKSSLPIDLSPMIAVLLIGLISQILRMLF